MENKKIERLNFRIQMIETELEYKNKRLEALTKELKEAVAKYDTYSIVTFVPGYVRQIEELARDIINLQEQKRMLLWIAKEEEDAR
ncbi:MAG: hypothetical protein IKJ99_03170 [Oscillospiraceae bacterium]|nr:hypothetical protein [Oscillospiraceae bacterium]